MTGFHPIEECGGAIARGLLWLTSMAQRRLSAIVLTVGTVIAVVGDVWDRRGNPWRWLPIDATFTAFIVIGSTRIWRECANDLANRAPGAMVMPRRFSQAKNLRAIAFFLGVLNITLLGYPGFGTGEFIWSIGWFVLFEDQSPGLPAAVKRAANRLASAFASPAPAMARSGRPSGVVDSAT